MPGWIDPGIAWGAADSAANAAESDASAKESSHAVGEGAPESAANAAESDAAEEADGDALAAADFDAALDREPAPDRDAAREGDANAAVASDATNALADGIASISTSARRPEAMLTAAIPNGDPFQTAAQPDGIPPGGAIAIVTPVPIPSGTPCGRGLQRATLATASIKTFRFIL